MRNKDLYICKIFIKNSVRHQSNDEFINITIARRSKHNENLFIDVFDGSSYRMGRAVTQFDVYVIPAQKILYNQRFISRKTAQELLQNYIAKYHLFSDEQKDLEKIMENLLEYLKEEVEE